MPNPAYRALRRKLTEPFFIPLNPEPNLDPARHLPFPCLRHPAAASPKAEMGLLATFVGRTCFGVLGIRALRAQGGL